LNETHACSDCEKVFGNENALDQHFQAKHNLEKQKARISTPSKIISGNSSGNSNKVFIGAIIGGLIIFGLFIFIFSSGSSGEPTSLTGQTILQPNEGTTITGSTPIHGAMGAVPQETNARIGNNIGDRAPDFLVSTTDGETIRLSDLQKEGKPVIVEFIATWCPHCNRDVTTLKDVYPNYSDKIEFLAIGLDQRENITVLSNWKQQNNFPVKLAVGTASILRDYAVTYTTTRYIISPEGIILSKNTGSQSASAWQSIFESLL